MRNDFDSLCDSMKSLICGKIRLDLPLYIESFDLYKQLILLGEKIKEFNDGTKSKKI